MSWISKLALCGFLALSLGAFADEAAKAPAQPGKVALPPGLTEEMLAPPPMPRFMLEKPAKPLTTEEMIQQAREAERRAGIVAPPKPANPAEPAQQ